MSSGENTDNDYLIAQELQKELARAAELHRLDQLDREARHRRESNSVPRVFVEVSDNNRVEEDTTNDLTIAAMLQQQLYDDGQHTQTNRVEEDTTADWDFAVMVQRQLNDDGQHTQSNRVGPSQSNKEEEEDDLELVQAIRESEETARVIQQAQIVSAEYSCNCEKCLYWRRAENQCGCFICKLKRTVRIWKTNE